MNSSFVYENIRMETPLRERSGGHAGTAPTVSFGWITRKRLMSFGVDCAQMVILFVWDCVWMVGFV